MNMKEKLSVRKVYRNAYRYVMSHLFAFAFLTIFYFLGGLPPLLFSAPEPYSILYQFLSLVYMYVFFYFAAGCYFRQQLLWDWKTFSLASLRFLMAVVLFCFSIFIASLAINVGIYMLKMFFGESGAAFAQIVLGSPLWLIGKYLIIFMLFVAFFIVPSFAFVSEITGRSRSLLMTYVKTKGSLLKIALASFSAWALLLVLMIALTYVHILLAMIARAAIFAFVSILYFKMYDFFYNFPATPKRDASGRFAKKIKPAAKPDSIAMGQDEADTGDMGNAEDKENQGDKGSNGDNEDKDRKSVTAGKISASAAISPKAKVSARAQNGAADAGTPNGKAGTGTASRKKGKTKATPPAKPGAMAEAEKK